MKNIRSIVFDLYGTLYDVHSVAALCDSYFPGRGAEISVLWRQKQLEYTWLRSLMGQYVSFEEATEHGLLFTCQSMALALTDATRLALCDEYLRILPYPEVPAALAQLQSMDIPLGILSNGSTHSINSVVVNSGLQHHFSRLISVEEVKIFKPHPSVYTLSEKAFGHDRSEILFVSSNSWDASGARHFGHPVCWINRKGNTFDQLGQIPNYTATGLDELVSLMKESVPV